MSKKFYIAVAVLAIVGCGVDLALSNSRRSAERMLAREQRNAVQSAQQIQAERNAVRRIPLDIRRGANFAGLLKDAGLPDDEVASATEAAKAAWNLRRIVPGHTMWAERTAAGQVKTVVYRIDADRELWLTHRDQQFDAAVREVASESKVVTVSGKIDGSLFESMEAAGEQAELAIRFADILAWDIDFYSDPRPGDEFSIAVEKKTYADGGSAYGRVLAVRYDNARRVYEAVLFHDPNGKPAYYSSDGKSLQKAFLRSPLKFAARISSHFSLHRFHPVLKVYRAHLGTDYAAPIGTPVQAVASGRVDFAGRSGGGGNMVKIQHTNGYETYYLHLSRILVRRGAHVQQGQRIGLVGMTGLATGPHLDFRVQRHGAFVNFESMHLPPANPVAKKDWAEFAEQRDQYVGLLANTGTAVAQAGGAAVAGGK